jgi:hypothetical protein
MADDMQRLVVSLEARIDQFQKALDKATGVADDRMARIQKRFSKGSDGITRGMARIGAQSLATQNQTAKIASGFDKLGEAGRKSLPAAVNIAAGMSKIGKQALMAQVEQELMAQEMAKVGKTADGVSHAIGAMTTQGMAAFHTLRGGTEMLLQGVSPMRVLAMEMNNITYAASGTGGLKGAFMEAIGIFKGMLNPVVAVGSAFAGLAAGVLASAVSFSNSQSKISLALTGTGKAAGVTVGKINEIADSVSSAGDLSRSEATTVATAIAATGKASADVTEKATGLAHAYSLVFNKDLPDSAKDLAAALADPAKGIDILNDRLGEWDASQVQLVKNLDASGDKAAAQQIILGGLTKAFADVESKTTLWGQALNFVGNKLSNLFTSTGKAVAGDSSPGAQLAAAQARLKQLQQGGPRGIGNATTNQQIAETTAEIAKLTAVIDENTKKSADQKATIESIDFQGLVKGVDPTISQLDKLEAALKRLEEDAADPAKVAKSGLSSDEINKAIGVYRTQISLIRELNAISKERFGIEDAGLGAEIRQNQIALQSINARTPAQKAEVAALEAREQALNSGATAEAAAGAATLARTRSLAQSQHDLAEAQRDRAYQSNQDLQQGELENSLIGRSIEVSTRLTAQFQALAAAKAEAFKNGTTVSLAEQVQAMADADQKARIATQGANQGVRQNVQFDIDQMGRSPSEQNVYSTLNGARLLDNGKIVDQETQITAALLRTREAMQQLGDTEKAFASSFINDLVQGKSAAESLGDALKAVASKLVDLGIDNLISGLKPANSGLLSFLGLADGGFVSGPGSSRSDSIPARLSNGEFVVNAGATKKNRALLEAINVGKVGKFASGGMVGNIPALPRISSPGPATPAATQINMPMSFHIQNGTPEGIDKFNKESLPEIRKMIRTEVVDTLNRSTAAKKAVRKA